MTQGNEPLAADAMIDRILAIARTERPAMPDELDTLWRACGLPKAPTLRALLLRSRTLYFPSTDTTLWGLSHEDGDGFDMASMMESHEPLVPVIGDFGWLPSKDVWCEIDFFSEEVLRTFRDDAEMLDAAFQRFADNDVSEG